MVKMLGIVGLFLCFVCFDFGFVCFKVVDG